MSTLFVTYTHLGIFIIFLKVTQKTLEQNKKVTEDK